MLHLQQMFACTRHLPDALPTNTQGWQPPRPGHPEELLLLRSHVSRPAHSSSPSPWMSDPLRTNRASLRAAERKWRKSMAPSDLSAYQSLLAAFSTAHSSSPTSVLPRCR
ncbi:hypothetical protein ANANG_G00282340 [Anguilla anguilla]|uniref:Uncharacterized protein n=1 Tax=Anguilla anguilla TaxID=7936 RepID=A0A9D3RKZ3_ANGAN|nr:hypothetical protein ANANG_G00282340 [Anguilla anguilla]